MQITLNEKQRLFVIPAGEGYTTASFDYIHKQLRTLGEKLLKFGVDVGEVVESEIGTLVQYAQYQRAFGLVGNHKLGTWFDCETPKKVCSILERYLKSGENIRLFYGDKKTGIDWMGEYDLVGRIGRSTGVMKIPLLVAEGEDGGGGILDACIVRMIDVDTRKELYRHPTYHQPEITIVAGTPYPEFTHRVSVAGDNHANFRSYGHAAQWVAFMTGHCMEQPE